MKQHPEGLTSPTSLALRASDAERAPRRATDRRPLKSRKADQLRTLVLKLRFGPALDPRPRFFVFSVPQVAELTGLAVSHVKSIVQSYRRGLKEPKKPSRVTAHTLLPEHVRFLTSRETLTKWLPFSLKRRAVLFHRQFPDRVTSATAILRVYRRFGVSFKKVKYSPWRSEYKQEKIDEELDG
ncbi:MAG: hypothetical protein GY700_12490, partial [Propionibacteriaceae bacterium]|nr:hypothetical protein [Propionibacteriaceae bacterium]